ncbi:hypothetical protein [Paenarthrobacter ilicis]|uniref:Energy-coupling factor transporter ATP-binding protein EcfA2 n=1 Tax=Paenarthrobacter ilicis TaxID=43665 RepID=A0ABX0TG61_9MICC|nr:hypothetical protein [Paenarthrobacter ilicis]MBM7791868.1 energy-coupling factor transporter ATP-binding protein EcfA2 [Paenarthrobacter ilicis]NIJ01507.1 energy-coupling factor transporter ATP-binding protein EcfA2 [Paenarthrobacter ilicis]
MSAAQRTVAAGESLVPAVIGAFFEGPHYVWDGPPATALEKTTGITLVTGPSGCGKSSILKRVLQDEPSWSLLPGLDPSVPLIDQIQGSLGERIALLARFGLGDAQVVIRPASWLSDGQHFRARLAFAVASGARRILVDEFLSTVDRAAASVVAHNLQRICRRQGIDLLVATAHGDLEDALAPDRTIRVRANDTPLVQEYSGHAPWAVGEKIDVGHGTFDDFTRLQRFHYYPHLDFNPEQREVSIVAATLDGEPIAARLYCAPYPRTWAAAVPEFARINLALTLGQRLVVHPVYRGIGLARRVTDAKWSPRDLIYTRSVMSRHTDMHSSLGYQRHEPLTNALPEQLTGSLRTDALRTLVTEYADYKLVMGSPASKDQVEEVAGWFARTLGGLTDEQLAASTTSTLMGGYVLRKHRPDTITTHSTQE